jgi:transketolase
MRSIPNMTVLVPGDVSEMKQVVAAALNYQGPVFIRLGAGDAEDVYSPGCCFDIGKATELRKGEDASIITTGYMVYEGICASDILRNEFGLKVRVLQMASIKPFDSEAVLKAAKETGFLVTVEEHNVIGGLGSAVCEVVAEAGKGKVRRIGIRDRFAAVGTASYIMKQEGLTVENIVKEVLELIDNKSPSECL